MDEEVVLYEAGVRLKNGNYTRFIESRDEGDVDRYIDIMQTTKPDDSVVVKTEKIFRCVSTATLVMSG